MYKRILVGTDGSKTAALAVERAVEIAEATGSPLTILTVGAREKAQKTAEAEAAKHTARDVVITAEAREGAAADELVVAAQEGGYDLLVVGNKGMTGATRFFLGSVPNKVSHHAPCALLIVRTT